MSASEKRPELMTVEEFLTWEPDDFQRYELVDGEPVAMAPPSYNHGALQSRLDRLIGNHLDATRPGCEMVITPGVVPRVRPKINFRIPDLGVFCRSAVLAESSPPEPVLLIEILSPSNQSATMMNVWAYTSIPSVREILILHSDRVAADVLRRADDGTWPDRTTPVDGDRLELASIGLSLSVGALYAGLRLAD